MEIKYLDEIIQFSLGKNTTRLKDVGNLYTAEDFEKAFHETQDGTECIINLIKSKAAPLPDRLRDRCITSNYLKCTFDNEVLDPWFFCYQFNESRSFMLQIEASHQGTTLSVKKLNIGIIGKMKIQLPDIKKQRSIGMLYRQSIAQYDLMQQQVQNYRNLMMEVIKKTAED